MLYENNYSTNVKERKKENAKKLRGVVILKYLDSQACTTSQSTILNENVLDLIAKVTKLPVIWES